MDGKRVEETLHIYNHKYIWEVCIYKVSKANSIGYKLTHHGNSYGVRY